MSRVSLVPSAAVTVKGDVVSRTVGDEMILLDLESGTYFTLNPVGALVWHELARGQSHAGLDSLTAAVVAEFEVDETTARDDISGLLGELEANGLVTAG